MTAATLVAAAAVLAGAAVQSGLGFGLAIVAAPVVAATDGPHTAAPTLALVSLATSALLLGAERRPLEVLRPAAARLVAWSLPGMAAGVALLALVPATVLSCVVAAAVLAAVALQARGPRAAGVGAAPAGFASGVLQTSVGLNGPPIVLHLLGRATAAQARDTLAAVFLALNAISLAVFVASGTFDLADGPGLLLVAGAAGWALGRLGFATLQRHHRALALLVLAAGAVAAVVQVVLVA